MEPARPLKNKLVNQSAISPKTRLDTFLKDVHSEQIAHNDSVAAALQTE